MCHLNDDSHKYNVVLLNCDSLTVLNFYQYFYNWLVLISITVMWVWFIIVIIDCQTSGLLSASYARPSTFLSHNSQTLSNYIFIATSPSRRCRPDEARGSHEAAEKSDVLDMGFASKYLLVYFWNTLHYNLESSLQVLALCWYMVSSL